MLQLVLHRRWFHDIPATRPALPPDTIRHRCMPDATCAAVVEEVAQLHGTDGLRAARMRLLPHEAVRKVERTVVRPDRWVPLGTHVRALFPLRLPSELHLDYEVLDFDVTELEQKQAMRVFICCGGVHVHKRVLMPVTWTAADIVHRYRGQRVARVLVIKDHQILMPKEDKFALAQLPTDCLRVEDVPDSHLSLPSGSHLLPVHLLCVLPRARRPSA